MKTRSLILKGVRQNNLQNIDLELPLRSSIVVTGPSGSGKSSLAFETIYAEGQRRYMQSLSTYARQFLEKFKAPLADEIKNIPPTIALEQMNPVRNSRATVGTSTEIYDYLRLLFEKIGEERCPQCKVPMRQISLFAMPNYLKATYPQTVLIGFHYPLPEKPMSRLPALEAMIANGYSRALWNGEVKVLEPSQLPKKGLPKSIDFVLDRLDLKPALTETQLRRVRESVSSAIQMGGGEGLLFSDREGGYAVIERLTTKPHCPQCRRASTPKSAAHFSFNSPLGACKTCKGFGNTLEVDPRLAIPNTKLSIAAGAIDPFTKPSLRHWKKQLLSFCKEHRIDISLPYEDLPKDAMEKIFEGYKKFPGVKGVFRELETEKYKLRIRVFVSRYKSPFLCPSCGGARLNEEVLSVHIGGKNIAEITALTFEQCIEFLKQLPLTRPQKEISQEPLEQLLRRLQTLITVGLGYLTSQRLTRTLSGGEYQRILLSTQLSQGLVDSCYVLDEPSIGLHPKDTSRLLSVLNELHHTGNTLIVVEHDPEIIEWGEHVVDMGPGSGSRGGKVVFAGNRALFSDAQTPTSQAMREWRLECKNALNAPKRKIQAMLELTGASGNNLKGIDIRIPLRSLVCITGVSGSGKSTLVVDTLHSALAKVFHGIHDKILPFDTIRGVALLNGVELVDQSPIGRSSRSNPITFIKAFDEIRSLFAQTPDAASRHLGPGHFSFNVKGGRCDTCEGEGRIKVDMVFMDDVWIPCEQCDGKRFKPSTLGVRYRGKNIDDCLRMTVDEAYDFFVSLQSLRSKLAILIEVGLGYLQLGQPSFTLSGGESQRLKIARSLAMPSSARGSTLFILDEPTTGLHFNEVAKLIYVFRRLIGSGHSVVVIEHNLQLICHSDYAIDLGPDGGEKGGYVVGMGTPKELAAMKLPYTGQHLAEFL